jgi:hypothetical protein
MANRLSAPLTEDRSKSEKSLGLLERTTSVPRSDPWTGKSVACERALREANRKLIALHSSPARDEFVRARHLEECQTTPVPAAE